MKMQKSSAFGRFQQSLLRENFIPGRILSRRAGNCKRSGSRLTTQRWLETLSHSVSVSPSGSSMKYVNEPEQIVLPSSV